MKRFGLSSKERIKSKKDFELIYSEGEILFSSSNKLKAAILIRNEKKEAVLKAAFAVSRKNGNAVWRNRVKRLLRESFRINKEMLRTEIDLQKKFLLIVFSPNSINQMNYKKIFLKDIMNDVIDLLNQIKAKL